ncbi:hypothetical protein WG899_04345 [Paucibacter sp. AS339]
MSLTSATACSAERSARLPVSDAAARPQGLVKAKAAGATCWTAVTGLT